MLDTAKLLLALLCAGFLVVGCPGGDDDDSAGDDDDATGDDDDDDTGDDDDDTGGATEFDLLADHMAAEGLDLPAMLETWIVGPDALFDAGIENYFIMDIRKDDKYEAGEVDFEEGHIPGAHSVAMADVVTYEAANNTDELPVVVYCYTGMSSGHAVMALRLAGVEDAQSMKWGMSGWHSDFDLWSGNTGNATLDYPGSWVDGEPPELLDVADRPTLATGEADGAAILASRIDGAILDGFNGVLAADVLADPEDYLLVNFWAEEDWTLYGHIDGAYQITPGELGLDTLNWLDPAETVVIYCWTGQTGSMVAAWLAALGYDAVDLKFGANTMIYDDLQGHTWAGSMDYTYDEGP